MQRIYRALVLFAGAVLFGAFTFVPAHAAFAESASSTPESASSTPEVVAVIVTPLAAPQAAPSAGMYGSPQNVALESASSSATTTLIYYTEDGSEPACPATGALYDAPVAVLQSLTLKAVACSDASTSTVAAFEYVVVAPPDASPAAGTYGAAQSVTLSATSSSSIRYTTDGTEPTCTSVLYAAPLSIASSTTIKAVSCFAADTASTSAAAFSYVIDIPAPAQENTGGGGSGNGGGNETLPTARITLQIVHGSATLINEPRTVTACAAKSGLGTTVSAYCALEQSGLGIDWMWFGDDAFLNTIAGRGTDGINYWGWFGDFEYGLTSLNQHVLSENEHLLLTLGIQPLRLRTATLSPQAPSTVSVEILQFGFDENWNGVWLPALDSTLRAGGTAYPAANGIVALPITGAEPVVLYASKNGYLQSSNVTLSPMPSAASSGGGGGSASTIGITSPATTTDLSAVASYSREKALAFLERAQRENGSLGPLLVSDWGAIALAESTSTALSALSAFLAGSSIAADAPVTEHERRALALLALGIDPYAASSTPVTHIAAAFDGSQIGDPDFVNDDIFAVLPLVFAGYEAGSSPLSVVIPFILSQQRPDGSWEGSSDLTAAAVQSLAEVRGETGVEDALARARSYLKRAQKPDGTYGNVFSTSWAYQALAALGEASSLEALGALQQQDGGFEPAATASDTRVWATAYAAVALAGKPWGALLSRFPRPAGVQMPVAQPSELPAQKKPEVRIERTAPTAQPASTSAGSAAITAQPQAENLAAATALSASWPLRSWFAGAVAAVFAGLGLFLFAF